LTSDDYSGFVIMLVVVDGAFCGFHCCCVMLGVCVISTGGLTIFAPGAGESHAMFQTAVAE
jgi:hypothetical protein